MVEPSLHDAPHLVATDGDWKIWAYRGAAIRCCGLVNELQMPNHRLDGKSYVSLDVACMAIDRWLDHGEVPEPYVWPVPPRRG